MRTRFAEPARGQAEQIDRWWRENRPAAPDTFALELNDARLLLEATPDVGTPYQKRHGTLVRRLLLPKSRNHLYYEVDHRIGVVMVLALGVLHVEQNQRSENVGQIHSRTRHEP